MTPHQIALVQDSFAKVVPIKEQAATLFYGRLFELDPALKPLFKGDLAEQGRKLMAALGTAVTSLRAPEKILPALRSMGARHAGYGVKDKDYDTVAAALLWTLEKGLGDAYTADVRDAWVETYTLVAGVMKQAAKDAVPAA